MYITQEDFRDFEQKAIPQDDKTALLCIDAAVQAINEYLHYDIEEGCEKKNIAKGDVPSLVKLTALQIASLFLESAQGNIATSSTAFADMGTRVFNNFQIDKLLSQLEPLRLYDWV